MIVRPNEQVDVGNFTVNIVGNSIECVDFFKYLGIEIDDNLSWKTHIHSLESELSRISGFMCKLRHYVSFDCLRSFYFAKVYSKIQYAILAWGGISESMLNKVNVLHNNIIRIMTLKNMPSQMRLSTKPLFKSVNILQLKDIFHLELAKFMHQATNNNLPPNLNQMFTRISLLHRYPTSSSRNRVFAKPIAQKSAYNNWISTTGITLWENISPEQKNLNFVPFKKSYRKYLIDSY